MEEKYRDLVNKYAYLLDTKNFVGLQEILWEDFAMTGAFELKGADNFITSLDQLNNFESTMHRVSNIQILDSNANHVHGSCYCIASHIGKNDEDKYILDMGIIYKDVAEERDSKIKLLERNFSMVWQEQRSL
jgi:hypothetical protein